MHKPRESEYIIRTVYIGGGIDKSLGGALGQNIQTYYYYYYYYQQPIPIPIPIPIQIPIPLPLLPPPHLLLLPLPPLLLLLLVVLPLITTVAFGGLDSIQCPSIVCLERGLLIKIQHERPSSLYHMRGSADSHWSAFCTNATTNIMRAAGFGPSEFVR